MPPTANSRRVVLGQLGGSKGTKPRGVTYTNAQKKRRKTDQSLKKEDGKGPSDNRFNANRKLTSQENR